MEAWLAAWGALPPVVVGEREHALELDLAAEARAMAGWLRGEAPTTAWPADPSPGQRVEVPLGGIRLAFARVRERVEVEEPFVTRVATRRILGLTLAWREDPGTRWVERTEERVGTRIEAGMPMPFRWCPPGSFTLGSPESDTEGVTDERPQRPVRLARGFWLGETPVTQAEYLAVLGGENPSRFMGDDLPVENVTCADAERFCAALAARLGRPARLPREAEWEYAARAGSTAPRYGPLDKIAWYRKSGRANAPVTLIFGSIPRARGRAGEGGSLWPSALDGDRQQPRYSARSDPRRPVVTPATLARTEHDFGRQELTHAIPYLDNGYRAMLAELDGQIVGHVWWFDPRWEGVRVHPHLIRYDLALEPGQVWSFDLYLLPQHRGGGASNDFFALLREHLRGLGYTRVFGHVDATNTPAVWLHKVQGYKPVKTVEARLYGRLLLWSGGRLLVKNPPFIVRQKFDFHPLW